MISFNIYIILFLAVFAVSFSNGFLPEHSSNNNYYHPPPPQQQQSRRRRGRKSSSHNVAILSDFSTAYTNALIHHKLLTESLTAASLGGLGDFGAQLRGAMSSSSSSKTSDGDESITESFSLSPLQSIDIARCGHFVFKGSVSGILWSKWYAFCDPLSTNIAEHVLTQNISFDGVNAIRVIVSIILEQIVMCPTLFALWEIPIPLFLRGDPIDSIPGQVQTKLGTLLLENAKVWSIANLLIYNIPLQWRVVVVSFTELIWQSIVSSTLAAASSNNQEKVEGLSTISASENNMSIQEQLNSQMPLSEVTMPQSEDDEMILQDSSSRKAGEASPTSSK